MKIRNIFIFCVLSLVLLGCEKNKSSSKEMSEMGNPEEFDDKVSYIIGFQIGKSFSNVSFELNSDWFLQGLGDASLDVPKFSREEISKIMLQFNQKMRTESQKNGPSQEEKEAMLQREKEKRMNQEEGNKFLEENKKKQGIVTLPSGLQYQVLKEGKGETPKIEDQVETHYRGTLINGKEFDSSYKRNQPAVFPLKGVIKGWTEALQLMPVGSKWKLFIPSELAYGTQGSPPVIPPNATLIFEIELLSIKK